MRVTRVLTYCTVDGKGAPLSRTKPGTQFESTNALRWSLDRWMVLKDELSFSMDDRLQASSLTCRRLLRVGSRRPSHRSCRPEAAINFGDAGNLTAALGSPGHLRVLLTVRFRRPNLHSQSLRGNQRGVDPLMWAHGSGRNQGQWRRDARFETVKHRSLGTSNACKPRRSSLAGCPMAPRSISSGIAPSRPRCTTCFSSTPQASLSRVRGVTAGPHGAAWLARTQTRGRRAWARCTPHRRS